MSEFLKRTLSGAIYVILLLAGTLIHPLVFALAFGTLMIFSLFEYFKLIEKSGFSPLKISGTVATVLLFIASVGVVYQIIPKQFILIFIPLILVLLSLGIFKSSENSFQNNILTLFGVIYIGFPFSLSVFLVHPGFPTNAGFYPWILCGVFFIIWINDSMAYLGGSLVGKHKLAGKISPQKTWEGFISGAVFAIVMGLINAVLFQSPGMFTWLIIAVITVVFGTLGDLFQSSLKRAFNVKDSGNILPGHGGFLDRLDSLLFAIPAVYFWLVVSGNF